MNSPMFKYEHGHFLGNSEDMSHNPYSAYQENDEIVIVYANTTGRRSIAEIEANMDAYLWTPFIKWVDFKKFLNSPSINKKLNQK